MKHDFAEALSRRYSGMKVRTNLAFFNFQIDANRILTNYMRKKLSRLANRIHQNLAEDTRIVTAPVYIQL